MRRLQQALRGHRRALPAPPLVARYGPQRGAAVKYAEAFEICEYRRQPDETEIRRLPFFP